METTMDYEEQAMGMIHVLDKTIFWLGQLLRSQICSNNLSFAQRMSMACLDQKNESIELRKSFCT